MKARWSKLGVTSLAPLLSLAVLVVFSQLLPTRVKADPDAQVRRDLIKVTLEGLPFFVGNDWVGEDLRDLLAPEAQDLLRPNAVFNRRYERAKGEWVHLLVVHCADARDMIGHYPPICYPSGGWIELAPPSGATLDVDEDGPRLPVREYRFRKVQEGGRDFDIRIFNAFVLPDGTVTRDIGDINRQSERLAISARGVAQIQVITHAALPLDEALSSSGEVLAGMDELFDVLGVSEGAARDS